MAMGIFEVIFDKVKAGITLVGLNFLPEIILVDIRRLANLRERDHWGDPDVDGRIILRWIFRKWEGVVGTGWS